VNSCSVAAKFSLLLGNVWMISAIELISLGWGSLLNSHYSM